MKNILIYRTDLLPASETFIAGQNAALERYSPWFAGLKRDFRGLPVDAARIVTLTSGDTLRDKLLRRVYLRSGVAPSYHRRIRSLQPALIHAHFAVDACAALPLRESLRVPLIVTLHGYDVASADDSLKQTALGRTYLHRKGALLRQASLFLCVSEHIRQRALERGFPPEKLVVHRIGIDLPDHASQEKREPVVLFVGRMVEKKGVLHLIRAMERVESALPDVTLVLLGDGPLRAGLEHEAKKCLRKVLFLGMQPPGEVRRWMQRARLLVAPSIVAANGDTEGLPTVLCESQAMGLPVVSFRGPGVNEAVIADETALLVKQRDERALGDAILRLMRDETIQSTLAAAGRRRAAQLFDVRKQTALLEEKYDEVLSRFARTGR